MSPLRCAVALLAAGLFAGCSSLPQRSAAYLAPVTIGTVTSPDLSELSGLAASRRTPGLYWAHNDSGDTARIFALASDGTLRGEVRVTNAVARDWEDIAAFTLDGQDWLLIADTGDNRSERTDLTLYLLPEPAAADLSPAHPLEVAATAILPMAFPEGPRDCEGVTVSPATREILLLSKRTEPPVLYTLPLVLTPSAAPRPRATAQRVTPLADIIPPSAAERAIPGRLGEFRSQVTGFDLSTDDCAAAVLTYGNIWVYAREPGETWTATFTRAPARVPVQALPQAEAVCFPLGSHDLIVSTEAPHPPLQRYPAR